MVATSLRPDPDRLYGLIGLGYDAALAPSGWRSFAAEAASAFGSDLAMIEYRDETAPERSFLVTGGLGETFEAVMNTNRATRNDDSYWTSIQNEPVGTVLLGSEVVQPAAMHRTDNYARIAMPWRLEHFLFGSILASDGVTAVMSLGRRARAEPFVSGDKEVIAGPILAHLRRSFQLHREIDAARDTSTLLSAAMDHAPWGLVVFDSRGKPVVINRQASAIFTEGDGLTLLNGSVLATDALAQAQLEWALAAALETARGRIVAPPPPVLLLRETGRCAYRLVFSPISLRTDRTDFPPNAAVVLMIHEERRAVGYNILTALRATYGLTRAEVRLCQALLEGQTLLEAAAAVNVSRNTAKTHLARVFDKTGVRTQVALLRLLTLGTRG
ncbi:MAG: hypothetical protein ABI661_01855 [Gammaproteobacteria bacterium]